MNEPIVYIVQNHLKKDPRTREFVPKFDYSPAREFGEFRYLLGASARSFHPGPVVQDIRIGLQHYTEDDYLLLVGNPVLIGWVVAVAADISPSGVVTVLQWDAPNTKYIALRAKLRN